MELENKLALILSGIREEVQLEAKPVLTDTKPYGWRNVVFGFTGAIYLVGAGKEDTVAIESLIRDYTIRAYEKKIPLITETEYEFLRFFPNDASLVVGDDNLVSISRGSSSFVLVHFNLWPFNSVAKGEDREYTVGKLIGEYERVNCPRRERNE